MLVKQLSRLKSFVGIATGLMSFNYFCPRLVAMSLELTSEVDSQENQVIEQLQETVDTYHKISSIALNLFFELGHKEEKITTDNPLLTPLNSVKSDLPETSLIGEDELLELFITKKPLPAQPVNNISQQKPKFSWPNLFASVVNKFNQSPESQKIAILPSFRIDQAFQNLSYINISPSETEDNLDSPLDSTIKDQVSKNKNISQNPDEGLFYKNLDLEEQEETNTTLHAGLNHQLVRSVIYNQYFEPIKKDPLNKKITSNVVPLVNNFWSYYFIKGQQDSNPQGLINNSSESYATKQFQLNQEIQEKIDNKTKNINTIIQRSF